jgi:membrane protease YdiL (CAAX protease family)
LIWTPGSGGAVAAVVLALALAYQLLLGPWLGLRWFRQLRAALTDDPSARERAYLFLLRRQLTRLVIAVLAIVIVQLSVRSIGLLHGDRPSRWGHVASGSTGGFLVGAAIVFAIQTLILIRGGRLPGLTRLLALLPRTSRERRLWTAASVGAGVSEELWFRAVLPCLIFAVWPHLTITEVLWIQAGIFGISHVYQRVLGVVGTTLMGLAFGWLVLATGTIWLAVAVHAVIDARFALIPARHIERMEAAPRRR